MLSPVLPPCFHRRFLMLDKVAMVLLLRDESERRKVLFFISPPPPPCASFHISPSVVRFKKPVYLASVWSNLSVYFSSNIWVTSLLTITRNCSCVLVRKRCLWMLPVYSRAALSLYDPGWGRGQVAQQLHCVAAGCVYQQKTTPAVVYNCVLFHY